MCEFSKQKKIYQNYLFQSFRLEVGKLLTSNHILWMRKINYRSDIPHITTIHVSFSTTFSVAWKENLLSMRSNIFFHSSNQDPNKISEAGNVITLKSKVLEFLSTTTQKISFSLPVALSGSEKVKKVSLSICYVITVSRTVTVSKAKKRQIIRITERLSY